MNFVVTSESGALLNQDPLNWKVQQECFLGKRNIFTQALDYLVKSINARIVFDSSMHNKFRDQKMDTRNYSCIAAHLIWLCEHTKTVLPDATL